MDLTEYGPFANVVAAASALVATFSVLLLKMLGRVSRWTWLASDAPSFLVTAGARMLAVAFMAVTYVTINNSNYYWFGAAAVLAGALGFVSVVRFDRLRRRHVLQVDLVNADGGPLLDKRGQPRHDNVVIGPEDKLLPDAAAALKEARARHGGVSLAKFMSGYGSPVNDPAALWPGERLADIGSRLTITLMGVVLFAVMTVFLAAFVIEGSTR